MSVKGSEQLVEAVDRFVSGQDISIALANFIEVALDDACPDDDRIQEVVAVLAAYRPGGGEFLYDEFQVGAELRKIRGLLQRPPL